MVGGSCLVNQFCTPSADAGVTPNSYFTGAEEAEA